jgi:hypothetical protein
MTWPSTPSTPCTPGVCYRSIYRGLPSGKRRDIQIVKLSAPSTSTTHILCRMCQLHTATVSRRNRLSVKHPGQKLLADTLVEKELELIEDGPIKAAEDHDVLPM